MSQFEYLVTFTAFLYAVMVGRIFITLSGLSLKNLDRLHVAWLIILVANLIQAWWKGWSFHDMEYNYGLYLLEVAHNIPFFFVYCNGHSYDSRVNGVIGHDIVRWRCPMGSNPGLERLARVLLPYDSHQ